MQGLPFFGPLLHEETDLVVYAPSEHDGRTAAEVLRGDDPPAAVPDRARRRSPATSRCASHPASSGSAGSSVASAVVPHVGEALGYRVTHDGVERRLHQRSPAADRRRPHRRWRAELCDGVDLLIHDAQYTPAEFARKRDWGHCTIEYAVWLAGEVGARRLALYHHDPTHDDDMIDRLAAAASPAARRWGWRCSPPARASTVDLGPR